MNARDIKSRLGDISAHVEGIAIGGSAGGELATLGQAIHNLVGCVADLTDEVNRIGRAK
jgi:hypothetical protein